MPAALDLPACLRRMASLALVAAMLLSLGVAHAQSQPWPIRNFQVVEMTEDEIGNDTGGVFNDAIDAVVGTFSDDVADDPASAEQREKIKRAKIKRAKIEKYLGDVAHQLQAWGFPPPVLGRVVRLENGELAYRVYSVASGGASRYFPSNGGDGANGGHMRINLAAGDLSRNVDFQDYVTIAHELFHAIQYNTRFFSVEPGRVGDWITEGQAEAVGEDLAWAGAPDDALRDTMDWGRRNYSRPLPIARRDPGGTGEAYDTASFWRYLAERDHLNLTSGPTVRPGISAPKGAVRYGYLASLLSNPPQPRDCHAADDRCPLEIQWLNAGLRGYDNFRQPLRKIFPEFAVTVAAYGDPGGRVPADNTSGLGADYWRSGVLADCVKEIVDGPIREYQKTLRFKGVSARCVFIPDLFNGQAEVLVEARASSSELLDQIVFGLAGDPKNAKPMLTDGARARGEKSTIWPVRLTPGRDNVLVFANVALDAPKTNDQELEIDFLLEYASMGTGSSNKPAIDKAMAAGIGEPVPLSFDKLSGYVSPVYFQKAGDEYIGYGDMAGMKNPCMVRFFNLNSSRTGDRVSFHMNLAGPVSPGRYLISDTTKALPQDVPGTFVAGFAIGADNPISGGVKQNFHALTGNVTIDSVSGGLLRGRLEAYGERNAGDLRRTKGAGMRNLSVTLDFAVLVKGAGRPVNKPYACLQD